MKQGITYCENPDLRLSYLEMSCGLSSAFDGSQESSSALPLSPQVNMSGPKGDGTQCRPLRERHNFQRN